MSLSFEIPETKDQPTILKIYCETKKVLLKARIFQWRKGKDQYPEESYIKQALFNRELYVLKEDENIIGCLILNQKQSEEWKKINWLNKGDRYLVIHGLVINPPMQGKGYGKKLMHKAIEFAHNNNYQSIRLDSFSKNRASNNLYINLRFKNCGSVIFNSKPKDNQEYWCYELLLN